MRKKSVNYDLIHYTKHQLLTTYKSKARDLIYYPWNWITSSEKRNKKKKHRTFFTRAYWKLKKQISSKLIILPLKIFILDVTSYPFNGCKRVKRYVKKRNKKTT